MDTSKEYIKMCDCDEVSENRRVEVKEQKDGRVHLILGANADMDFNSFGGTIGLQYTP
ncbi:hypothetical protein LCGC14_2182770, partial [marine sediment metagenome]